LRRENDGVRPLDAFAAFPPATPLESKLRIETPAPQRTVMNRIPVAALITLSLLPLAAGAQEPPKVPRADLQNGAVLAKRWCAGCHIVASDQTKGVDGVPSFAAIARGAAFGGEQLAFFLLDPHPAMPSMTLTRNEARDLAAYIAAQK
jgi:mono/diheme cytochrome c family protein